MSDQQIDQQAWRACLGRFLLWSIRCGKDCGLWEDRVPGVQVGATVERDTAYPGWAPNPGSAIVGLAKQVLEEVTGHTVKVPPLTHPSRHCKESKGDLFLWVYCICDIRTPQHVLI